MFRLKTSEPHPALILEFHPQLRWKLFPIEIFFFKIIFIQNPLRKKLNLRSKAQICKGFEKVALKKKLGHFELVLSIRYLE